MSTAGQLSFDSESAPPLPIHRFTVEQYRRLGELGVLTPEDRVELLEGWIVQKMNQRPAHGFVVGLLTQLLTQRLPQGWILRCQLPLTTARSEPEPDLAVILGTHADFRHRHPGGNDCRLVIEVADTSIQSDRAKAAIYASAGVAEYWIINLVDRQLERFSNPDGDRYRDQELLQASAGVETEIGGDRLRLDLGPLFSFESSS